LYTSLDAPAQQTKYIAGFVAFARCRYEPLMAVMATSLGASAQDAKIVSLLGMI
jgi:hypothetical protein